MYSGPYERSAELKIEIEAVAPLNPGQGPLRGCGENGRPDCRILCSKAGCGLVRKWPRGRSSRVLTEHQAQRRANKETLESKNPPVIPSYWAPMSSYMRQSWKDCCEKTRSCFDVDGAALLPFEVHLFDKASEVRDLTEQCPEVGLG
jgi:hypothetical protein